MFAEMFAEGGNFPLIHKTDKNRKDVIITSFERFWSKISFRQAKTLNYLQHI